MDIFCKDDDSKLFGTVPMTKQANEFVVFSLNFKKKRLSVSFFAKRNERRTVKATNNRRQTNNRRNCGSFQTLSTICSCDNDRVGGGIKTLD